MIVGVAHKQYGLTRPRSDGAAAASATTARPAAFADDDDSDLDGTAARAELAREQAVAAQRAAAMAANLAASDSSLLDYDAWKDNEDAARATEAAARAAAPAARAPRYIGTLLAKAEERSALRDIAFERRLARERELEEAEHGAAPESFVTEAYAAKLAERRAVEAAQAAADAREAAAAAASAARGMGGFYGNLSRNVALGGGSHAGESIAPRSQASATTTAAAAGDGASAARPPPGTVAESRPAAGASTNAAFHSTRRVSDGDGPVVVDGRSSGGASTAVDIDVSAIARHTPQLQPGQALGSARLHGGVGAPSAAAEQRGDPVTTTPSEAGVSALPPTAPPLPPWARRTSAEEIEDARRRAEARFALRKHGGGHSHATATATRAATSMDDDNEAGNFYESPDDDFEDMQPTGRRRGVARTAKPKAVPRNRAQAMSRTRAASTPQPAHDADANYAKGASGTGTGTTVSLTELTQRFLQYLQTQRGAIDAATASAATGIAKRRVYDITSVLEGLGLVAKPNQRQFLWKGGVDLNASTAPVIRGPLPAAAAAARNEARAEIARLDSYIEALQEEMAALCGDEATARFAYLTHEQLRSLPTFSDSLILAVRYPPGTVVEVPDPLEDDDEEDGDGGESTRDGTRGPAWLAAPESRRRHPYRMVMRADEGQIDVIVVSQIASAGGVGAASTAEGGPGGNSAEGLNGTAATNDAGTVRYGEGFPGKWRRGGASGGARDYMIAVATDDADVDNSQQSPDDGATANAGGKGLAGAAKGRFVPPSALDGLQAAWKRDAATAGLSSGGATVAGGQGTGAGAAQQLQQHALHQPLPSDDDEEDDDEEDDDVNDDNDDGRANGTPKLKRRRVDGDLADVSPGATPDFHAGPFGAALAHERAPTAAAPGARARSSEVAGLRSIGGAHRAPDDSALEQQQQQLHLHLRGRTLAVDGAATDAPQFFGVGGLVDARGDTAPGGNFFYMHPQLPVSSAASARGSGRSSVEDDDNEDAEASVQHARRSGRGSDPPPLPSPTTAAAVAALLLPASQAAAARGSAEDDERRSSGGRNVSRAGFGSESVARDALQPRASDGERAQSIAGAADADISSINRTAVRRADGVTGAYTSEDEAGTVSALRRLANGSFARPAAADDKRVQLPQPAAPNAVAMMSVVPFAATSSGGPRRLALVRPRTPPLLGSGDRRDDATASHAVAVPAGARPLTLSDAGVSSGARSFDGIAAAAAAPVSGSDAMDVGVAGAHNSGMTSFDAIGADAARGVAEVDGLLADARSRKQSAADLFGQSGHSVSDFALIHLHHGGDGLGGAPDADAASDNGGLEKFLS